MKVHDALQKLQLTHEQTMHLFVLALMLRYEGVPGGFDMAAISKPHDPEAMDAEVCCDPIGWASLLIAPRRTSENWGAYCVRVFGLDFDTPEWMYCFGVHWANSQKPYDRSCEAAGARILQVLRFGIPQEA